METITHLDTQVLALVIEDIRKQRDVEMIYKSYTVEVLGLYVRQDCRPNPIFVGFVVGFESEKIITDWP